MQIADAFRLGSNSLNKRVWLPRAVFLMGSIMITNILIVIPYFKMFLTAHGEVFSRITLMTL